MPDCGPFGMLSVLSGRVGWWISGRLVVGEGYFCWSVSRELVKQAGVNVWVVVTVVA